MNGWKEGGKERQKEGDDCRGGERNGIRSDGWNDVHLIIILNPVSLILFVGAR